MWVTLTLEGPAISQQTSMSQIERDGDLGDVVKIVVDTAHENFPGASLIKVNIKIDKPRKSPKG